MEPEPEIELTGCWQNLLRPNRRWSGAVRAPSAFAVLAFGSSRERVVWAKSRSGQGSTELPITFDVHDLEHEGSRAQLLWLVGDAYVQKLVIDLEEPDCFPTCSAPMKLRFGLAHEIFHARGVPQTTLGLFLLPRSFVNVGRSGVWRVREDRLAGIPQHLISIVLAGRSGDTTSQETP